MLKMLTTLLACHQCTDTMQTLTDATALRDRIRHECLQPLSNNTVITIALLDLLQQQADDYNAMTCAMADLTALRPTPEFTPDDTPESNAEDTPNV